MVARIADQDALAHLVRSSWPFMPIEGGFLGSWSNPLTIAGGEGRAPVPPLANHLLERGLTWNAKPCISRCGTCCCLTCSKNALQRNTLRATSLASCVRGRRRRCYQCRHALGLHRHRPSAAPYSAIRLISSTKITKLSSLKRRVCQRQNEWSS